MFNRTGRIIGLSVSRNIFLNFFVIANYITTFFSYVSHNLYVMKKYNYIKTTFNYIQANRHFETRKAALYASKSAVLRIKKRRNLLATTA